MKITITKIDDMLTPENHTGGSLYIVVIGRLLTEVIVFHGITPRYAASSQVAKTIAADCHEIGTLPLDIGQSYSYER